MDIIPKFREIDIYVVAISLVLAIYLSSDLLGDYGRYFFEGANSQVSIIAFIILSLYAIIRSIYFAWTKSVPGRAEAMVLMVFALGVNGVSSFIGGLKWLLLNEQTDILTSILAFFVMLGIIRTIGMFMLFRLSVATLDQRFDYTDSPRHEIIYATILVFLVGIIGHLLALPGIVLYFAMVESSRIAHLLPRIKVR